METFSVDDVVDWLNVNGFEDVSQRFYGMYSFAKTVGFTKTVGRVWQLLLI